MRFYFIRHAQSADNQFVIENAYRGIRSYGPDQLWFERQADPDLSDVGRRQVQQLCHFLSRRKEQDSNEAVHLDPYYDSFDFTHIYTSLMIRTLETASAIGDTLHLKPIILEEVHETGGFWEADPETGKLVGSPGQNREFFKSRYPHCILPDHLGEEGWWNRPLETASECQERARRFLHLLMERHGGTEDRIAVVSHGLFYSFLMNAILKIPPEGKVRFPINNAAITRIDFTGDYTMVIYQNRVDFLPPELIT
ncbi:MAG: histidine phosphatase family protein [Desulfobacteraceae bacterium]|nr:MAG: histidine phosphatase family protein [Desulfobacteraceae bacterium]